MYKAINQKTEVEVIILHPAWSQKLRTLRDWGKQDVLVCQECRQPVRLRAGQIRAWHFAHKVLRDCPIGHESAQLLQARALLYHWLVDKFGAERVTVEKRLEGVDLPRPIDCWIAGESVNFAYWIFEKGLKPPQRKAVQTALNGPDVIAHWVFLASRLRQEDGNDGPDGLQLPTTEREFMQPSNYDAPVRAYGRTLHYLDHDTGVVTTYRGLIMRHSPHIYEGQPITHALGQILASPRTGEFVHPGEYERLKAHKEEQETAVVTFSSPPHPFQRRPVPSLLPKSQAASRQPPSSSTEHQVEAVCEFCGQLTRHWWFHSGKTGLCRCQNCKKAGRTA